MINYKELPLEVTPRTRRDPTIRKFTEDIINKFFKIGFSGQMEGPYMFIDLYIKVSLFKGLITKKIEGHLKIQIRKINL